MGIVYVTVPKFIASIVLTVFVEDYWIHGVFHLIIMLAATYYPLKGKLSKPITSAVVDKSRSLF